MLAIISVMVGLDHQTKEEQIQSSTPATENNASSPGGPHFFKVMASDIDKAVRALNPPSQHARITVARIVKVRKLDHACKDDPEGVATRDQYRQSAQESSKALSHGDRIEARAPTVEAPPRLGVMCEVTGQQKCQPDHG